MANEFLLSHFDTRGNINDPPWVRHCLLAWQCLFPGWTRLCLLGDYVCLVSTTCCIPAAFQRLRGQTKKKKKKKGSFIIKDTVQMHVAVDVLTLGQEYPILYHLPFWVFIYIHISFSSVLWAKEQFPMKSHFFFFSIQPHNCQKETHMLMKR